MYANGRWSPPEPAGPDNNRYRLVTADEAKTAAIVIEGSGEPVSVRFREPGGRFVEDSPPVLASGKGADASNAIGMGGDGTLYAMVPERETVQTGVSDIPEVDLQRLRVLVRSPGAGWITVPDAARIFERALARYNAGDTGGASALVASELQPVSAVPAGGGDVLLLWARALRDGPSVLEGAIGRPGRFGEPVQLMADASALGSVGDVRVAAGRLIVTSRTGSVRRGRWHIWSGPLAGPLTEAVIPLRPASLRIGADGSVIALAGESGSRNAALTVAVRAPDGTWALRPHPTRQPDLYLDTLTATGEMRGTTFDTLGGRSAVSWGVTCVACGYFGVARPNPSGRPIVTLPPRLPVLFGVVEDCPPIPLPGSACGRFGSGAVTFTGPLWLDGADASDDPRALGPLVTMVDGRPLAVWAAERWTGRGQGVEDVVLASHDAGQSAPPARITSFQTSVGARRCNGTSCARFITVRVRLTAPSHVALDGVGTGGRATNPRFGRSTVVFRFWRPPGRYRVRPVVPGAPRVQGRTVRVT